MLSVDVCLLVCYKLCPACVKCPAQHSAHGGQCCWEASGAAARRQQKCSGVAIAGRDAMDCCIPVSLGCQVVRALPDTRRCLAVLVNIGPARARISLEIQWNKPLLKTCCWFLFFRLETCHQSILNNDFTNSTVEWLPKNSFCGTSEGLVHPPCSGRDTCTNLFELVFAIILECLPFKLK